MMAPIHWFKQISIPVLILNTAHKTCKQLRMSQCQPFQLYLTMSDWLLLTR